MKGNKVGGPLKEFQMIMLKAPLEQPVYWIILLAMGLKNQEKKSEHKTQKAHGTQ